MTKKEVVEYLSLMDVALVNLKKSDTFKTVIPSKIFEAAAMEKPILLGLEGETQGIIEKYNAGICYEPENSKDLNKAIQQIIQPNIYKEKLEGTKKLLVDFDRKNIAAKMLDTLREV